MIMSNVATTAVNLDNFSASKLASSALIVNLSLSVWTGRKLDRRVSEEVDQAKSTKTRAGNYHKNLMAGVKELEDLGKYAAETRNWFAYRTLPWGNEGTKIVDTASLFDFKHELSQRENEFWQLVDAFELTYNTAIQAAQFKLGALFNADEYPPVDDIRSKFGFRYYFSPVPEAGDFRVDIGAQGLAELQDQFIKAKDDAIAQAMSDMWGRVREVTERLSRQLRVEKDAKGNANPLAGSVRFTMGFGVSLSGRYLRHHVELGMNADEKGRRVFDGVLAHTGGIGKVFANELFSHAGRTATQHEDRQYPENWFPFAFATSNDAMTGKTGSLFLGADNNPLVISTNTSTEYWQKGASLLTTDPAGTRDLDDHSKARTYFITGTQHVGNFNTPSSPGSCAMPRNPHDAYPAIRALLVALDEWISTGKAPPPSRVPRIADGTRLVSLKLACSLHAMRVTGATTICAILSPRESVTGRSPRFTSSTDTSPR